MIFAREVTLAVSGITRRPSVPVTVEWDERWFGEKSSFEYNHNLARVAGLLASISYTDVLADPRGNVLAQDYRLLGFGENRTEFFYDVDYADSEYGNNQVAFSLASKELPGGQEKRTLVLVIIRGTPTSANEWLSNLNINDSRDSDGAIHEGFALAARQVSEALSAYLARHNITPESSCFLIAGHSRGAAVTNLFASWLRDNPAFDTSCVYAYTFAAPNVTTDESASDESYNYIHNIVNAEDIVPVVPLYRGNWTYRKFGQTHTLVNFWNSDGAVYDEDVLVRVNVFFNLMEGRDYVPFRLGPFIPVQVSEVLSTLNPDVEKFYSSSGLHDVGAKVLEKMYAIPAAVVNEDDEDSERHDRRRALGERIVRLINSATGNLYDQTLLALNDMHTGSTYLSYLLALDEDEAFSDVGCSQLIVSGREEGAVFDPDGNLLLRVMEGRIQYSSLRPPVAARPVPPGKIAVGFPGTLDFDFVCTNESLLPTPLILRVEQFDAAGRLVGVGERKIVSPHKNSVYAVRAGAVTVQDSVPAAQKLPRAQSKELLQKAELFPEQDFRFIPEISLDLDLNLSFGLHAGSRLAYGILLAGLNLPNPGNSFELLPGIGTQQTLFGPLCIDFELFPKCVFIPTAQTDAEHPFALVPQIRTALSVRPTIYFAIFAAGCFDIRIDGFNNDAFLPDVRRSLLGNFDIGERVSVYPTLKFGMRMQLGVIRRIFR